MLATLMAPHLLWFVRSSCCTLQYFWLYTQHSHTNTHTNTHTHTHTQTHTHTNTHTCTPTFFNPNPLTHLMLRVTTHPMQLATNHGNLKLVRYLLTAGADKDAKSKHGKTAYDIARANRNDRLTKLLDPDAPLPDEAQQQEQQQQQQKQ